MPKSAALLVFLAAAVISTTAMSPVCLPREAVSRDIVVVIRNAQLCPETAEDEVFTSDMSRRLQRLVRQNTSLPAGCNVDVFMPRDGHHCRQTGNRKPTNLKTVATFKATVTCSGRCNRHTSDRMTEKDRKSKKSQVLLHLRTKKTFRMRYNEHPVTVTLFKGRRSVSVSCPLGETTAPRSSLNITFCRCPAECPPLLVDQSVCPVVPDSDVGICEEQCTHDRNCTRKQMCCSNGCGHVCMEPASPPRYEWFNKCVGACSDIVSRLGSPPPGKYVPQCNEDGSFSLLQLWGSTGLSWCVDRESGKALTGYFPRGQLAQCEDDGTGQPQLVRAACPLTTAGGFGICIESCSKDSGCEEGELCCSNGCGHVCMAADNDSPPHYKSQRPDGCRDRCAWQKMTLESSLAIGAYIPQCDDSDEDGRFLPVQVWGSTGQSWCVDTKSGKPTSGLQPPGQDPNCS